MRARLDVLLHRRGLFESRELARAAVMEGLIRLDGKPATKAGMQVSGDEEITVERRGPSYVSRGGVKLEHALDAFGINVLGMSVLDVGSSTGGFTDCLLQRGAGTVTALDVGRGQLHWRLRQDSRVKVMEGRNARYLRHGELEVEPGLATVDVSFISLRKVLEPLFGVLAEGGRVLSLVKPQFEAGRREVGRGGVVRDPEVHFSVLDYLVEWMKDRGMAAEGVTASPIRGPKGNIEFFLLAARGTTGSVTTGELRAVVAAAHGLEG